MLRSGRIRLKGFSEDEYAWLENAQDPKVVKWAHEQDRIARKQVRKYSDILYNRMVAFYKRPVMRSVQLTKRGIILFLSDHKSYKVQLLHKNGRRELLADSNKLGKDVVIQRVQARDDGKRLALHYSTGGSDEGTVRILELETGEVLDTLHGFVGNILWLPDESYYLARTARKEKSPDGVEPPTDRVYHRVNGKEEMVFGKGLPTNTFIELFQSRDGSKALLNLYQGFTRSRPYAGPIYNPDAWVPIYPDVDSVVSNIDYQNGQHILLSFEKSCGEILSTDGNTPRPLVGETEWPLQEAALTDDGILCHYLVDCCSELRLYDSKGEPKRQVKFDMPGALVGIYPISTLGSEAVVAFSSFTQPFKVYKLKAGRLTTVLSEDLPGKYTVRHEHAKSADGTNIHYFIVHKTGKPPKKVLLFGYGGFRVSSTPSFNPTYLPFLKDGGAFAVSNLRGGLEYGEEWHRAGMREKKFRVFEDYLAVLSKLKQDSNQVVGYGRSNGGLLMGATMNQRPELFDGVLIGYPVLDMMAYHRLLVGRAWVPEYGDPDNAKDREFLMQYSPYHNLEKGKQYPPIFIYSGLKDDRVHPAHAFKFYSKLKEIGVEVALRVETESGHIGTTPEAKMREEADKMAFVYKILDMRPGTFD